MKKARMIIDILMVILLPLLMAYSLIGENVHEVLGICMFALFDFGESRVRFLLDYAAIMVLVADIAHWIQTGMIKFGSKRRSEGDGRAKS